MRRELFLLILLLLAIRLPFLNQAVQGDDVYYLYGARHALVDPLHPSHARFYFQGDLVDMRGHPHPPLNSWMLAALLALVGDVREPLFHAAYLLFSLLALLAVWDLASRFCPERRLEACLLFLATPAFVINGSSLEADLPLLAFWLAGFACFLSALARRSTVRAAAAAALLGLASLTAYQALLAVPVLVWRLWMRRDRWRPAWVAAITPVVVIAAYQAYERISSGALPASMLASYLNAYGLQALPNKLKNAAALTVHLGWMIFPALGAIVFGAKQKLRWILACCAALAVAPADWHPLFWLSFGAGSLLVLGCWARFRIPMQASCGDQEHPGEDASFLAAWVLIFLAGAFVLFFAGSARYLLPIAAPLAVMAACSAGIRRRWFLLGAAANLLLGLALASVNSQHWDGYRRFVRQADETIQNRRVWINAEWGLRYYAESRGALPLARDRQVQPGEAVILSALAYPVQVRTGGAQLLTVQEMEVRAWPPLSLIGLGSRSGYSTIGFGLRPFDFQSGPLDRIRLETAVERKPELSWLEMNSPHAETHILSGVYELEDNRYRWLSQKAVFLLKTPPEPLPLRALLFVPDQAVGTRITLAVGGIEAAHITTKQTGTLELASSSALAIPGESATVTVEVDRTFSAPGDRRRLGVILTAIGFR